MTAVRWTVAVLLASAALASCTGNHAAARTSPGGAQVIGGTSKPVVRVGSFDFPESVLLAEIYGQALRLAGYPVSFQLNLGPREIVEPALQQGFVDFVPEYVGSAAEFADLGEAPLRLDTARARTALSTAMAGRGIGVLASAPAEDQNAIVVTAATARADHLRTIQDLLPYASSMSFGGPPECQLRPYCLPGLRRVYGLRFRSFVALDAGGPYTVQALERGDVQVALLFSSDAAIRSNGFVVLRDDLGLQQAENVTPVVRNSILQAYGASFPEVVNEISARLSTKDLISLNLAIGPRRQRANIAAGEWLKEQHIGD